MIFLGTYRLTCVSEFVSRGCESRDALSSLCCSTYCSVFHSLPPPRFLPSLPVSLFRPLMHSLSLSATPCSSLRLNLIPHLRSPSLAIFKTCLCTICWLLFLNFSVPPPNQCTATVSPVCIMNHSWVNACGHLWLAGPRPRPQTESAGGGSIVIGLQQRVGPAGRTSNHS